MAKKKNQTALLIAISIFLILAVVGGGIWGVWRGVTTFFHKADCFKIASITVDPTLSFLDKKELSKLYGRNIFTLDIKEFHRRLSLRYPQMTELKIVRRFPNQISIVAQKRKPALQLQGRSKVLVVDEQGVVLSALNKTSNKLPLLKGVGGVRDNVIGKTIGGDKLEVALSILDRFEKEVALRPYQILQIDVSNLSKIHFGLSNGLSIIVDSLRIDHNIRVLGMLVTDEKIKPEEINYVDLRFKEPVVGKKELAKSTGF